MHTVWKKEADLSLSAGGRIASVSRIACAIRAKSCTNTGSDSEQVSDRVEYICVEAKRTMAL